MANIVVDTNIVIWYFGDLPRLSPPAQSIMARAEASGTVFVASITVVELTYLVEKKRIPLDVIVALRDSLDDSSTAFSLVELSREVADRVQNIPRSSVPDMPDRIIAATALHLGLPLITSDVNIRKLTNVSTVW